MANETVFITLKNVESEHCALIVDNGLKSIEGMESHRVELNNNRAVLEGKNVASLIPNAVKVIRDLGYDVMSIKKTFPVLNMTCASCAISVESILKSQAGVIHAAVNYANASVQIEYLPQTVSMQLLKDTVQMIGYDLVIDEDELSESLEVLQLKQYHLLKRKAFGALLLSLPVVVVGMFFMDMPYANYIMWILSTPVIAYFGKDFFINAWKQAKHQSANMDTLVAISTGVAYIFSVFNTLFPHFWMQKGLHAHVYFEAAAVVIAFILLGKLLEEKAKGNTSSALKKLIGLQPKTVTVFYNNEHPMEMPIESVKVGDIILVKPGEKIALDGVVTEGSSYVDESMLSGEPVPVLKSKDENVFAGTINQKSSLQFKAQKVGAETLLAQIIKMVQDAQGSKAPVQKLVDKIAAVFVPVVILIAILSFIMWFWFGGENGFSQGLIAFVTVLIIACPCALGLATPTAIMVGIGKGAEKGILIKDAESLEQSKNINALILDKTGTITAGKPQVTDRFWKADNEEVKSVLKQMEMQSEHPLALAIVKELSNSVKVEITHFESLTGLGAQATFKNESYFVGNEKLIKQKNIKFSDTFSAYASEWEKQAKTVVYFANRTETLAIFAIADEVKETSKEAIKVIRNMGIDVYMLTGDNASTAKAVSSEVGIDQFKAGVLPHQKSEFVKSLQAKGLVVAMVGDGINDGAALAQADVSIAMGHGSDIAMDVANMTIISSDLTKISEAIKLSRHTVSTIKQNLFWAFIYNLIGIPLAAGIMYPVNGFLLNPMIAGAAMALSSVSVVSNSLLLKFRK